MCLCRCGPRRRVGSASWTPRPSVGSRVDCLGFRRPWPTRWPPCSVVTGSVGCDVTCVLASRWWRTPGCVAGWPSASDRCETPSRCPSCSRPLGTRGSCGICVSPPSLVSAGCGAPKRSNRSFGCSKRARCGTGPRSRWGSSGIGVPWGRSSCTSSARGSGTPCAVPSSWRCTAWAGRMPKRRFAAGLRATRRPWPWPTSSRARRLPRLLVPPSGPPLAGLVVRRRGRAASVVHGVRPGAPRRAGEAGPPDR